MGPLQLTLENVSCSFVCTTCCAHVIGYKRETHVRGHVACARREGLTLRWRGWSRGSLVHTFSCWLRTLSVVVSPQFALNSVDLTPIFQNVRTRTVQCVTTLSFAVAPAARLHAGVESVSVDRGSVEHIANRPVFLNRVGDRVLLYAS